jgi:hypothetical protein
MTAGAPCGRNIDIVVLLATLSHMVVCILYILQHTWLSIGRIPNLFVPEVKKCVNVIAPPAVLFIKPLRAAKIGATVEINMPLKRNAGAQRWGFLYGKVFDCCRGYG